MSRGHVVNNHDRARLSHDCAADRRTARGGGTTDSVLWELAVDRFDAIPDATLTTVTIAGTAFSAAVARGTLSNGDEIDVAFVYEPGGK